MANRILYDSICTSDTINELSPDAECTFYRLLVSVDDFGRIDGRIPIIKSRLFPLKNLEDEDAQACLDELVDAGLIWPYSIDGRIYYQVTTWDAYQRIRTKRSKYPAPPEKPTFSQQEVIRTCSDLEHVETIRENLPQIAADCSRLQQIATDRKNTPRNAAKCCLNPNPNPNPNPNSNPKPKAEGRVCAREAAPEHSSDIQPTAAAASGQPASSPDHLGDMLTEDEIIQEQRVQEEADALVAAYKLPRNARSLNAVADDIRTRGIVAVRAALDAATDSDKRGGISLAYYRAILTGTGVKARSAPAGEMVRHSREEWDRAASAAIVDLDEED